MEAINFTQVVRRGCGIDVHRDTAVATISGEGITTETRLQANVLTATAAIDSMSIYLTYKDRYRTTEPPAQKQTPSQSPPTSSSPGRSS